MKIYKVVADRKPNNCIVCPLMRLNQCGKDVKVQTTSSGAYMERVPDSRCLIRVGQPSLPKYAQGGIVKHSGLVITGSDYSNEKVKDYTTNN